MANEYVPHAGPIVTLQEARRAGLASYFTGAPCQHGHVSLRCSKSTKCRECRRLREQRRREARSDDLNAARRASRAADPERHRSVERTYRLAHPEKLKEKAKTQRNRHAGKISARNRKWREDNKAALRASKKAHYEANRDHYGRTTKLWRAENPDKCKGYMRARRAREKSAEGSHSPKDIERIYRLQRGKCPACKTALRTSYQVDHITALANGGSNYAANIQLLCRTCNRSKSSKDPITWAQDCGWLL